MKIHFILENTFLTWKYISYLKIHFILENTFHTWKYISYLKIHFIIENTFHTWKYISYFKKYISYFKKYISYAGLNEQIVVYRVYIFAKCYELKHYIYVVYKFIITIKWAKIRRILFPNNRNMLESTEKVWMHHANLLSPT